MTQFYVPRVLSLDDINHEEVAAACPPGTIFADVSGSNLAYWELLCDIWAKGEDFAIIEHDVLCRPDVVEQFEECPEPWCTFGYQGICHIQCQEAWANQLGLTRFRAEVMAAAPDAVTSIPPGPLMDWHNLCDGLGGAHPSSSAMQGLVRDKSLRGRHFTHHWHYPAVEHHPWFVCR